MRKGDFVKGGIGKGKIMGCKIGSGIISGLKFITLMFLVVGFFVFVSALSWTGENVEYMVTEEVFFSHDFVQNITGNTTGLIFSLDSEQKIFLDNGSGFINYSSLTLFPWILLNSSGNLTINSTYDYQTGKFRFPIQAIDDSDPGDVAYFNFTVNATNDIPNFISIEDNYIYPTNGTFSVYNISLSDEEGHYPLNFSINFTSCTHAPWTGRLDNENCTILGLVNDSNFSAYLNYTPDELDVGSYNATITVSEAVHSCPHSYCDSATYTVIQSVTKNITIDVLVELAVNVTDCESRVFTEGVAENCTIEVRTQSATNTVNLASSARFTTYSGTPTNVSWFYPDTQVVSSDFFKSFNVTINATHSLVGNWTINFTALDLNTSEFNISLFNVSVNWTGNNDPVLSSFDSAYNASEDGDLTIDFNVTDIDFLIEDKDFYDESISVSVGVVNISSGATVSGFNVVVEGGLTSSVRTFNVTFSPNSTDLGIYNVTINITDNSSVIVSSSFNLSVLSNSNPYWNATGYFFNFTVNSTIATTVNNFTNLNLSRSFANDSDITDNLTFANDSNAPPNFNLSSVGIINFYPWKTDVGFWEFNITVTDDLGLSNNSLWTFNISNVNSDPLLDNTTFTINGSATFDATVNQGDFTEIGFTSYDNDLFITDSKIALGAYNENLTVTTNIVNTTSVKNLISLDFYVSDAVDNATMYLANFTSTYNNTGNYSIDINLTDASGVVDTLSFNLSIFVVNTVPVISTIGNVSTSILNENFVLSVNATDVEDDSDSKLINYTIAALTSGAPDLLIGLTTGLITFNFSSNESYGGVWQYNVSVNDSSSALTSELFNLTVYGTPNVTQPTSGAVFDLTENSTYVFNFTIDYMVNNTNLTYNISLDNITYSWLNESAGTKQFNYSTVTVVQTGYFNWNSTSSNLSFSYLPSFYDETYGLYKNLTLIVYNSNFSSLNSSVDYNLNVSHLNYNITRIGDIPTQSGTVGTDITPPINLSEYFRDIDSYDVFYNELINYTMDQGNTTAITASFSGNNLSLGSSSAGTYNVSITAYEWDTLNVGLGNVTSNYFTVVFVAPTTTTVEVSTGGGGGKTTILVQHFALKIIAPGNIVVSPDDFVEINFSVYNNGNVDLVGIDLSSFIELSGITSQGIRASFSEDFIDVLKVGETKDYVLRLDVDTSAVGEYKISIFGNVTSPKFFDWGEFYIRVQSLDEGQLSQLLVFIEKLVSENPECLELRESYNEAQSFFDEGNFAEATRLAQGVVTACEDAISANEQIRFFDDKIAISLLYSLVLSLGIFFVGFAFYVYRRIKFKKSIAQDYI